MTGEQLLALVMVAIAVTILWVVKNRHRFSRLIWERLNIRFGAGQGKSHGPNIPIPASESLSAEERSKIELERLQKFIEDRKNIARETEISHHLWGFYKSHFRFTDSHSMDQYTQNGEWYNVNILQVSSKNGLHNFEFELKDARYRLVDDEEKRGWCENTKLFSLFLYDDSDRCLIEIPMKMKVDKSGRNYSVLSDGPKAFLPGDWINDFISVALKHQRMRNQEIRAQQHQERLGEIQDLKNRFGVPD